MESRLKPPTVALVITGALFAGLTTTSTQAATFQPVGPVSATASSIAQSVNSSGRVVGAIGSDTPGGPDRAWVAPGVALTPLNPGNSCRANSISNEPQTGTANRILGTCTTLAGEEDVTTWSSANNNPTENKPLSLLGTGLLPDTSAQATARSKVTGITAGRSLNNAGQAASVAWSQGNAVALALLGVPLVRDNCVPVAVNDRAFNNVDIALNCPNPDGSVTPKLATNGLLGFTVANLPLPANSHCEAVGVNSVRQVFGTCIDPATSKPTATYWATPSSVPKLLNMSGHPANQAKFANNLGYVAVTYQLASGGFGAGLWHPATSQIFLVNPAANITSLAIAALADSNRLLLDQTNTAQVTSGATWTVENGVQPLGAYQGQPVRGIDIDTSGSYAAATATVAGKIVALRAVLP
ncbi:hypothetical protein CCU68_04585 [Pseudomonas gingeri NCPPB 3146 = LMG 5327]|uniref:Uncharacterized protein n=2 Tax=Pseudomonas gingeri TaxID=117681 RepID=A0A7Y7XWP1_9PSED|nr:hypothetical protein [Pseudomonas gingeri]NWC13474.1 hypothetical protein [Pseudomonas gingeri]PNQ93772.1 hypothetical protein CCU68_04585 [Pseudomonas gingeri NCPPB 3146 = LMG 5327]